MYDEYNDHHCRDCGDDLFQLNGRWFCPQCDEISSFELVDDRDEFVV